MQPDTGEKIQAAGERVRDAAGDAAERGWSDLQPLLDFQLLHLAGITVTVGGLVAAVVVFVLAWMGSALLRRALSVGMYLCGESGRRRIWTGEVSEDMRPCWVRMSCGD